MSESNVDDENYEIIDYTTASEWEKFIASIERILNKWEVSDGRNGNFEPAELQRQCQSLLVKNSEDRDIVRAQVASLCTRTERISYMGTTYVLTLSIHPFLAANNAHNDALPAPTKAGRFDSVFPPVYAQELEVNRRHTSSEPTWHPMHRWTKSPLIIYIQYISDSSKWVDDTLDWEEAGDGVTSIAVADDYSVSLSTSKTLVSSFNIAARNTQCHVPMFVPVGDAWRYLFTGCSLDIKQASQKAKLGKNQNDENDSIQTPDKLVVRTKYESVFFAHAPNAYLQLNGLLELFSSTFNILSYAQSSSAANDPDTSARTGMPWLQQEWSFLSKNVQLAASHMYHIKNTYDRSWNLSLAEFNYRAGDLNIGPANDPLRVLSLTALFQSLPCSSYIDPSSSGREKLYLKTATAWSLSARFLPSDMEHSMLTEALEDAFAAWAQAADSRNRHRHLSLSEQMEAHAEITSKMLIDLFGSSITAQLPTCTQPDADTGKSVSVTLEELTRCIDKVYEGKSGHSRPLSVPQIIAKMPHGTSIPYRSLLWRLCEIILVTTAKRSAEFWRAPSIMTFLRLLWAMMLKEIRWRWEHNLYIPKVLAANEYSTREQSHDGLDSGTSEHSNSVESSATAASLYNVHLKYSLVYQKLEMLNCCQEQKLMKTQLPTGSQDLENNASSNSNSSTTARHTHKANAVAPSGRFASSPVLTKVSPDNDDAGDLHNNLITRIRSHVEAQIQSGLSSINGISRSRDWVRSSRMRRPIGKLMDTIRIHEEKPDQHMPSDKHNLPSQEESHSSSMLLMNEPLDNVTDLAEYEEVNRTDEFSDASDGDDGFISADEIANDINSIDRETHSSFSSVRLPPNAVYAGTDGPGSSEPASIQMANRRDSNYVDLTMPSSADSTSGFHHINSVEETEQPAFTPQNTETATPSENSVKQALGSGPRNNEDGKQSSLFSIAAHTNKELGDGERAGGLTPSDTLCLLGSDKPLWIPKTQTQLVVTEDMLRERETILMGLGTSSEGAKQRARLQCAELISDMESFKAANPGCALADFVRWHSPRDWIVPEGSDEADGHLSARMTDGAGNLWQELWADARRVPAADQQPLFDHNKEAEKALHYLEGVPVYSLFTSLLPTIFLIAYDRVYHQPIVHRIESLRKQLCELGHTIQADVDWSTADPDNPVYSIILDKLESLEVQTSRIVSLLHKFPGQYALVEQVIAEGKASVDDRRVQKTVLQSLNRLGLSTMQPARREYVFHSNMDDLLPVHTKADYGNTSVLGSCAGNDRRSLRNAAQKMHVVIEDDQSIRLVYSTAKVPGALHRP